MSNKKYTKEAVPKLQFLGRQAKLVQQPMKTAVLPSSYDAPIGRKTARACYKITGFGTGSNDKHKLQKTAAITAPLILLLAASCVDSCGVYTDGADGHKATNLSIATWNVQALFDGQDNGIEYEEYRAANGWNDEKYRARLNNISKALKTIEKKGPDIIALIEVEKSDILKQLAQDYLAESGYKYSAFAGLPGYSLGVGVLSRHPLTKTRSHSSNTGGAILPRPVVEVWVEAEGLPIVIFICHWKSKLGGDLDTEPLRRAAARVVLRRVNTIKQENPDIPIMVLGDLNENHDEFIRHDGELLCALLPDSPEAAKLAGYEHETADEPREAQDFFILSTEKPPQSAFFSNAEGIFYTPWGTELEKGTYYYSGGWETIDHVLLNKALFDSTGWEFKDAAVMDGEPFVNTKDEPDQYNTRSGYGLSDHLPLLLTLTHR
ncbi:MAG: endonuclease/exonuclease/phosphatase family protein [Spirochaetaceae bacterium]|jgi:endonuclease/exonuclease/phosphatase family metal-dependent hydrolase|nr:endonuclease/exonuclease/phosphatase family protein [Spirochaetaceae bacterium]